MGTQLIRGISGGERKRTNIGMELIIDPSVLFLDEPTTGLDASTANSVLSLLKRYTHTHSPSRGIKSVLNTCTCVQYMSIIISESLLLCRVCSQDVESRPYHHLVHPPAALLHLPAVRHTHPAGVG